MTPWSLGCLCTNLTNLTTRKVLHALILSLLEFIVISGSYNAPLALHLKGQGFLGYKFLSLYRAQATSYYIVAILTLKCSQKKVQNLHDTSTSRSLIMFLCFLCNCFSCFITSRITFTGILYLQWIYRYMIYIIYTSSHSHALL